MKPGKPIRYAVIGTGALGGFYGARLAHAGCDVHFLARSDVDHIREHGLAVQSKDGDFVLDNVDVYASPTDMPPCDVVLVALKATQNHVLPDILPHVVRDGSAVVLMQNGLGYERDVAKIVGPDVSVLGGLCFLCSNKTGPGHIHHLDYGYITLAAFDPADQPRGVVEPMPAIAADFERAGIPLQLENDLLAARWKKLVWNVPYNGLSVVLDATTDELMRDEHTRALCEALMYEVALGAMASCQREIPDAFIEKMLDQTHRMKPYRTSMKVDADSKRPMEVEAIFGNPWRAAQAVDLDLPRLEALYQQLAFIDARNQRGAASG